MNYLYFFIWQDWKILFRSKSLQLLWDDSQIWNDAKYWIENYTEKHIGTLWEDIDKISYVENSEKITNEYILEWKNWTLAPIQDLDSITKYWKRTLKESKTDLGDVNTAQIYANSYIEKNKDSSIKLEISLNNKFILEKLNPMDLITILNIDYDISNLQINKIDYTINSAKLYIESFDTLWKEIFNL